MTVVEFLAEGHRWCDPAAKLEELGCQGWRDYVSVPDNWATIEGFHPWGSFCRLMLELNGWNLLTRWLSSTDPTILETAEGWAKENWRLYWPNMSDHQKRRLLEMKEIEISRLHGKASVLDEIAHALRDAFPR